MRILMVAARYLPFMGGIEAHVYEVAMRMAAQGHDVTVLTTDPTGALARVERHEKINVVRVKAWPKKRDFYFAPEIAGHIARGSWDVVHIQGYHTLVPVLAMAAAISAGVPFVLTFHSGGHSSHLRNALRTTQHRLLAPLVRRAAQLIAVSEFEADRFSRDMRISRQKFTVVPNGAQLAAAQNQSSPGAVGPLIVSIGRARSTKATIGRSKHFRPSLPSGQRRVCGFWERVRTSRRFRCWLSVLDCAIKSRLAEFRYVSAQT